MEKVICVRKSFKEFHHDCCVGKHFPTLTCEIFSLFPWKNFSTSYTLVVARLFGGRTRSAAFHACLNSLHRRMTHSKYTAKREMEKNLFYTRTTAKKLEIDDVGSFLHENIDTGRAQFAAFLDAKACVLCLEFAFASSILRVFTRPTEKLT